MRTKKSRKADLEGKKAIFFEIGLIIALGLSLVAFEWSTKGDVNLPDYILKKQPEPEVDVPIFIPEKIKTPPPPAISIETIVIRDDNEVLEPVESNPFDEITEETYKNIIELVKTEEDEVDEIIDFTVIETKPTFMGGGFNRFNEWVFSNLCYPEEAIKNGIQGRVYLEFMIDKNGNVTNVQILKGIDPLLDAEASRVVASSPRWNPGFQRNKPVNVMFKFSINFRLK
ncbi:MAG TPA: TonB family protein [Tenuifilaceae bacterium]|nr:TonB family protein [Tenuifilaceae bacterium]